MRFKMYLRYVDENAKAVTFEEAFYMAPPSLNLFQEYHEKYPSHGYRWLNAKIRLDTGLVLSDPYAHILRLHRSLVNCS